MKMTKIAALLLAIAMLTVFLGACGITPKEPTESTESAESAAPESEPESEPVSEPTDSSEEHDDSKKDMVTILTELVEASVDCMRNVTSFNHLKTEETPMTGDNVPGENVYKVIDEKINTMAALRDYLSGIYTEEVVKDMLEGDRAAYIEVDGVLAYNMDMNGQKGYYVCWDKGFTVDIKDNDLQVCTFTVTVPEEVPAAVPTFEDRVIPCEAHNQNGEWRLARVPA